MRLVLMTEAWRCGVEKTSKYHSGYLYVQYNFVLHYYMPKVGMDLQLSKVQLAYSCM